MKPLVIAIVICFTAGPAWGQQQTLIRGNIESGGYGAPVVKLSWLDGEPEVLVGGQGGWIINHAFVLGGAGFAFATVHYIDNPRLVVPQRLEGGYGGLLLEYYVMPFQIAHLRFSSVIGAGGLAIFEGRRTDHFSHNIDDTAFFVAEPGAGIAVNVTTFFRVGLEASYRFVVGSSLAGFDDSDLSAPAAMLSFQFGSF